MRWVEELLTATIIGFGSGYAAGRVAGMALWGG